ncbi:L-gulonolactone oxidase 3 [Hirschfeldia incana]|nr:L-gulonolactone oxidase 3 [Hirschfeldia incana]
MRFSNTLLLLILFFLVIIWTVRSVPPEPPVRCDQTGCTVSNAYGVWPDRKNCNAANVTYPTTEEELIKAVAYASEHNLKVKTVTKFSSTIPKLACPSGSDAMLISTSKYNSAIEIEPDQLTVTADSGVSLRELIDRVEAAGFSIATSPYWEGVTIGGLISTGSHGSSWSGRGGSVHDHVVGINLVVPATSSEGYAKVINIEEGRDDKLLDAVKVSLGVLGVISKVTLSIEKAFKRSITYNFTSDVALEDIFMEHGKKFEFGDITWYPSRKTAVYRYDFRSPDDVSGNGVNDFTEKALETSKSEDGKCKTADTTLAYKKLTGNGLKNNGLFFTGYPVIGTQGKLQSSGSCLYSSSFRIDVSCSWDPRYNGLSFYETTAIFPVSRFRDFLLDVKKLRDLKPERLCGIDIYNGILIRFIKGSKAFLGQTEDSVVIDFNYYRAEDALTPRLNQDVMEEMEQMAFVKYGAKPHWGKNRKVGFFGVKQKFGPNFDKFLEVEKKLDPKGMFSSEWSDEILFGRENSKYDGCALEGNCVCSEDRHCSPSEGYFCRQGLVYTQARVCRFSSAQV